MRLTAIRNGPKRIISASGELGRLQMVSEPNTGRCASEDAGPQGGCTVRSHIDWRGDKAFLIKVWKPLLINVFQNREVDDDM